VIKNFLPHKMETRFRKNKKCYDAFIKYLSLSFEMIAIIDVSTFLGLKIEQWMTNQIRRFTLLFKVFSIIGAVYYFIRKLLK